MTFHRRHIVTQRTHKFLIPFGSVHFIATLRHKLHTPSCLKFLPCVPVTDTIQEQYPANRFSTIRFIMAIIAPQGIKLKFIINSFLLCALL